MSAAKRRRLMASIEGKRGMPRPRPPFPASKGLWGKPTILNNVETFANIPRSSSEGGEWYAAIGTEKQQGHQGLCPDRRSQQYRAG